MNEEINGSVYYNNECKFFVGSTDGYENGNVCQAWEIAAETREDMPKKMHVGYSVYDNFEDAQKALDYKADVYGWMKVTVDENQSKRS